MKMTFCCLTILCVALVPTSCNTHKQHTASSKDSVKESKLFINPDQPPYYIRGGNSGLLNDLYSALLKTAPVTQDSVNGRAIVKFTISVDGQIDTCSIKILRNKSVPDDYLQAAIEAIKKLGNFEPGKQNGTPLRVAYTLPVIYPVPLKHVKTVE